jgi:CheY-like chemotaxis protein
MKGSGGHILLVQDDALTREAMALLLGAAGYAVVGAANGRDALDRLVEGERPWLILLDLEMPVMDGWEFRRRQQQVPALSTIPVVLVSSVGDLAGHAAALGAAGYFPKPVEFDGLLGALRALAQGRWTRTMPTPSP